MPRLSSERDARQIFGGRKDVTLSGDQGSAERGIEKIFLVDLPGNHLLGVWAGGARRVIETAGALPGNSLFGRSRTHSQTSHRLIAPLVGLRRSSFRVEPGHEAV